MPTVLIVDDYPAVRKTLRSLLETECSVVCIEAINGLGAIAETEASSPDLIILDLGMPGMNGFEAARFFTRSSRRFPSSCSRLTAATKLNCKRCRWEYAPCFQSTRVSTHLWRK